MGRGDRPTQDHRPLLQGHVNWPQRPDARQTLKAGAELSSQGGCGWRLVIKAYAARDSIVDLLLASARGAAARSLLVGVLALPLPLPLQATVALAARHAPGGKFREEAGQIGRVGADELARLPAAPCVAFVSLNLRPNRGVVELRLP